MAEGHGRTRFRAVLVARTANIEVCPSRNIARAGDSVGVGLKEVCVVEGRSLCCAGKNDEEDHSYRTGKEDEGDKAQGRV